MRILQRINIDMHLDFLFDQPAHSVALDLPPPQTAISRDARNIISTTGIPCRITVCVLLVRIGHQWTIVANIASSIPVTVALV